MGLPFDHVQYGLSASMILGATMEIHEEYNKGALTNFEMFRTYINPGFNGVLSFIQMFLNFWGNVIPSGTSVTWKWQIRCKGQTAWADLHAAITAAWSSTYPGSAFSVTPFFDAVTPTADDVPYEVRLVVTTSVSTTLIGVKVENTNLSFRTVGESV